MDEQKPLRKKLLEEAWRGIVGNAAWFVVLLVLGSIGTLLVVIRSWVLGTAVPAVLAALSTKVVLTIGMIIIITITSLVLGLFIIWSLFARRHRLEMREHEQAIGTETAKRDQRIAELEKHKEDLLKIQRSNLDRLNEQTREANELRSRLQEQTIFKAIYCDPDYWETWIKNPEAIAKFFDDRGFEVVNAQQLKHWVYERMEHNESCRALLVFAQDVVPHTVADVRSDTCELRLFLNEGGRVVWHGDVPFWYQGHPGRKYEEWGKEGLAKILGVGHIPLTLSSSILTEKGRMWGMVLPGLAERAVPSQDVNDVFAFLPYNVHTSAACSWRKVYNPHFPHSGFLRYWPWTRDGRDASVNAEYFRFATSCWNPVPEVELPEIEIPRTQTFVSGNEVDEFRPADTDEPWQPAAIEHRYRAWIEIPEAQWIWWQHWVTPQFRTGGAVEHRRDFELDRKPQQATLMIAVDDRIRNLRVNDVPLRDDVGNHYEITFIDLTSHVHQGTNRLKMIVVNVPAPPTDENPTGLCYRIDITY